MTPRVLGDVDLADGLADDPGGALTGAQAYDAAGREVDLLAVVVEGHRPRPGQHDEHLVDLDVGRGAGRHLPHADLDPGDRGERARAGLGGTVDDGAGVERSRGHGGVDVEDAGGHAGHVRIVPSGGAPGSRRSVVTSAARPTVRLPRARRAGRPGRRGRRGRRRGPTRSGPAGRRRRPGTGAGSRPPRSCWPGARAGRAARRAGRCGAVGSSCAWSGASSRSTKSRTPVVVAEQRQQSAQVHVLEPVHDGVLVAPRLGRGVGDLLRLAQRPGDAGAGRARCGPRPTTTSWCAQHARGHAVDEFVGVRAEAAVESSTRRSRSTSHTSAGTRSVVRCPDDRRGDLVEVRPAHGRPDRGRARRRRRRLRRCAGNPASSQRRSTSSSRGPPPAPVQQLEVGAAHQVVAVAVVQPVQREGGGGPLRDGDQPLRGALGATG